MTFVSFGSLSVRRENIIIHSCGPFAVVLRFIAPLMHSSSTLYPVVPKEQKQLLLVLPLPVESLSPEAPYYPPPPPAEPSDDDKRLLGSLVRPSQSSSASRIPQSRRNPRRHDTSQTTKSSSRPLCIGASGRRLLCCWPRVCFVLSSGYCQPQPSTSTHKPFGALITFRVATLAPHQLSWANQ